MRLDEFYREVHARVARTGERLGQAAFNLLDRERPDLSRLIRGSMQDPFHTTSADDTFWMNFTTWMAENWNKPKPESKEPEPKPSPATYNFTVFYSLFEGWAWVQKFPGGGLSTLPVVSALHSIGTRQSLQEILENLEKEGTIYVFQCERKEELGRVG